MHPISRKRNILRTFDPAFDAEIVQLIKNNIKLKEYPQLKKSTSVRSHAIRV